MSLSLPEAWLVLGRDPKRVADAIRGSRDRVEAAQAELEEARKIARGLLALHHPDRNQGSPKAAERFRLVQEAIEVVEKATEELRATGGMRRVKERDVFIEVDKIE